MNLNFHILTHTVIISELWEQKQSHFYNVLKCHHFDPFTHQTLFAQTATFSEFVLGGSDLACSLHNHFFLLCLLYLASNLTCLTNKAHRHLHPHAMFSKDFFL